MQKTVEESAGQGRRAVLALLGSAFDTTGVLTIAGRFGSVDVQVRIWAAAGIRVAGAGDGACGENTAISSITLSPPFLGKDGTVGIGSTRAEVEADVGAGTVSGDVVVYGDEDPFGLGDPALGVVYVEDTQCVERAAALVFNYFDPNN